MSTLSSKVMHEISEKKIAPIPKWQFFLKDSFVWSLAMSSVLIGAFAVAISLHQVTAEDNVPINRVTDVLSFIPYFWLLVLILFVYVAFHNFHHTEGGYRYKTATILGIAISASIILGSVFAAVGFGGRMNSFLVQNIPYYSNVADRRSLLWMQETEGRIAGRIVRIFPARNMFILRDLNGNVWEIEYGNAEIRPLVELREGTMVKILGTKKSDNHFEASDIRPWTGGGKLMQGNVKGKRITR